MLAWPDAIARTVERSPELAPFAFSMRAQDARIVAAGQRPALVLGGQLDNFAGTGAASGLSGVEATVTLSGVIELGGQRERRVDAARAARDLLDVERQSRQLDVLAETGRRFIHVAADQEQLRLTQLATRLAEDTTREVERRVQAARSPEVELSRARIALSRARVEQEHAEHELLSSRRKLAAMWGAREAEFARVEMALFDLPAAIDYDMQIHALAGNPDFIHFATEARQRDAELQLEMARARASLTWNAGIRRLQRDGDMGLVAGFSMPLQGATRARPAIAEARARRDEVEARAHAAQVTAEAALYELVQELRHAVTEAELLRDEVLPQIESALAATEYAWQRGRYSYLEWTDAQRERIEVQRALIEAAANAHQFHIEIERLTGAALDTQASEETVR